MSQKNPDRLAGRFQHLFHRQHAGLVSERTLRLAVIQLPGSCRDD